MDSKVFFQACQEGDLEKLSEVFGANEELDINGKDGFGMTALGYAARNGHVEVVRQLLLKGADRTEVLEQGYGGSNAEIARLLESGPNEIAPLESQGADGAADQQELPMHAMTDDTYMNGGATYLPPGYPMMPGYGAPLPGQQFYYDGMHSAPAGSVGRMSQQQGHSRKESNTGLPPPEVARSIPCRYFPNCRYGDKCMFAHPIMAMSAAPPGSAPLSPSMSAPHMQPMFYQHMPAGYPYPGPYGAGPQFFPSMGPVQPPYGMVAPFNQPVIQPQHSLNGLVTSNEEEESLAVQPAAQSAEGTTSTSSQNVPGNQAQATDVEAAIPIHSNGHSAIDTPPQQDGVVPISSQGEGINGNGEKGGEEAGSADSLQDKPAHRRQSFNSFLHHHAIPFQPAAGGMGMMNTMQPFMPRSGPKGRRAPGINGGKRSNAEKPACVFFAGRGCRIGDECRFPHILPDGTDARSIQAQQRQMYATTYGEVSSAMPVTVNGASDGSHAVPTGPLAEKKSVDTQHKSRQESQQTSQPMLSKSSTSQSSAASGGPAGVVPSIPSKTSTGTSPTVSRGSNNKKQNHHHQQQQQQQQNQQHHSPPAQRIPTVNDFPALAVPSHSPNLSGQSAPTPSSPPASTVVPTSISSIAANGDAPSSIPSPPAPTANGKRANFSAILSAPAPPKAKAAAETTPVKSVSPEENGYKEDDAGNVRDKENHAKTNGVSKDPKPRSKDAKASQTKVDSYKGAVIAPSKAALQDEDDFQVVHRSRTSNSNQVKAVAA